MHPQLFKRRCRGFTGSCLAGLGTACMVGASVLAAPVDFNSEVRPLLSSRCYSCHGADEESRKAKLRLDLASEAVRERGGIWAIKPGAPEESEVLVRIESSEPLDVMPPPKAGERLTEDEIAVIRRWIAEGAHYEEHWAWSPPERGPVPVMDEPEWTRNPIDSFVRARQMERGLERSKEADGYALARRVALDLTGIPPTFEQTEMLVGGQQAGAYERLVDELLASPRFGEHWGRMWMDLARYADSAGYGSDPLRPNLWPWREWVIKALNANMSYDQFTREQLAGDLIPGATTDQWVATAFHRNTMTNTEGGTDDEEYRVAAVKDRANTTAQVWMGLTLGCAQCHTHKFDPISHREYYKFFAFFNQTEDNDQPDERPTLPLPTALEKLRMDELQNRMAELERQWLYDSPEMEAELAAWEMDQRQEVEWRVLRPTGWRSQRDAEFVLGTDGFLGVRGKGGRDTQVLTVPIPGIRATAVRVEWKRGGEGAVDVPVSPRLSELSIAVQAAAEKVPRARVVRVELPGPSRVLSLAEVQVIVQGRNAASAGVAAQSSTRGAGEAARAIDGRSEGSFDLGSVTESSTQDDPWWEVDLGSEQPVEAVRVWNRTDAGLGTRLTDFRVVALDGRREEVWSTSVGNAPDPVVELRLPVEQSLKLENASTRHAGASVEQAIDGRRDGDNGWMPKFSGEGVESAVFEVGNASTTGAGDLLAVVLTWNAEAPWELGGIRLSVTEQPHPVRELSEGIRQILLVSRADRTETQWTRLREYYRPMAPSKGAIEEALREVRHELGRIKPVALPILRELPVEKQRTTRVLLKGNFLDPGDTVEAGVPEAFHPWPAGAPFNRLGLAQWLTSRENPLTARVAVNRLWARLFGMGLVETEEDFGTQGTLPSHQELLDWLAVEFMDRGWDMKAMLRLMVTSATYRQSAIVQAGMLAEDPRNRWLSRASRLRLDAETVRDQALWLGGLLSMELGGPSVFPPQPEGLWRAAFNGERDYPTSTGSDRYRRGIYVFVRRTVPNPTLAIFDAPSRETCTFRRLPTNTPLQAFVTLNDPVYVEAARGLARRIMSEGGSDDRARVRYAIRLCLGRPSSGDQEEIVLRHLDLELGHYGQDVDAARALIDEPSGSLMSHERLSELAAWTSVANVLLNLDALMNRG